MRASEVITNIKDVITLEVKVLDDLLNSVDDSFVKAIEMIVQSPRKIILSGMGKSGLIAKKISSTFSSTGTASVFLHPSEALHGDIGIVERGDTLILIGKSGESDELVGMIPILKKLECGIIAITANKTSTLAIHSDAVLYTPIEKEACSLNLAPTCSTTAALVIGDALAVTLMKIKNFSREDFALFHPSGRIGKRLLYKVNDLMRGGSDNPVVSTHDRFDDIILSIGKGGVNAVSVVNKRGVFKGLITGYDLRTAILKNDSVKALTAEDIMFPHPITIPSGVYAIEAFELMKTSSKPLDLLPVIEKEKPVGIITMQTMIRAGL